MVLILLGLLGVQVASGFFARASDTLRGPLAPMVGRAVRETATAVHSFNIWLIAAAVGVHVVAITVYLVVKDQDLVGPMITGRKRLPVGVRAPHMRGGRLAAATLAIAAAIVWAASHLG